MKKLLGLVFASVWFMGCSDETELSNYAAYFAEIYRAGIQSIDNGQREASYVLGYNRIFLQQILE